MEKSKKKINKKVFSKKATGRSRKRVAMNAATAKTTVAKKQPEKQLEKQNVKRKITWKFPKFPNVKLDLKLTYIVVLFIYFLMLSFIDFILFANVKHDLIVLPYVLIAVNLGLSLIFCGLYGLFKKIGHIIICVFLFLLFIFTIMELAIFSTFNAFMPFSTIFANATDVLKNYGNETSLVAKNVVIPLFCTLAFLVVCLLLFKKLSAGYEKIHERYNYISIIAGLIILIVIRMPLEVNPDFTTNVLRFGLKEAVVYSLKRNNAIEIKDINKIEIVREKVEEKPHLSDSKTNTKIATAADTTTIEKIATAAEVSIPLGDNVLDIDFSKYNSDDPILNQINKYVESLKPTNKNRYTGIFKGKNLILICAEAYSHYVLDPVLTPTLYRLTNNGIRFNDFYVPSWGGSTSSGEFAFLTGLIPCEGADSMRKTVNKNMVFTMPRVLKKLGYKTGAYHNGKSDYYDRNVTHAENIGFDFYMATDNGLSAITHDSWPTDELMFEKTFETYCDDGPFCMYYMTMSGHAFYNDSESFKVQKSINKVKEVHGDKYPEQVNNYICYQMYLEDAVKKLVDMLEEKGMLDDTVICMVADHYPYGLKDNAFTDGNDYLSDLYGDKMKIDTFEIDKNMPILWSSVLEKEYINFPKDIDEPTSSIDLLPTFLNMFGIDYDSRFIAGRDVFSDNEAIVMYNNGKWRTKKGTYILEKNKTDMDSDYVDITKMVVNNKILYSKYVVDNDYYNLIFGDTDPFTYKENKVREVKLKGKAAEATTSETLETKEESPEN